MLLLWASVAGGTAVPVYSNSSTAVVCTSIYVVVEPRAQQSTAQHSSSAITPAQSSEQPSTYRSEYVRIKITMYVHACCVRLLSWSMELLAFASRLITLTMLNHLLSTSGCNSNPLFLASERSGRNRLLREAPKVYTYIFLPFSTLTRYVILLFLLRNIFHTRNCDVATYIVI